MRAKQCVFSLVMWLLLAAPALATVEFGDGVSQEFTGLPGEHFGAAVAVSGNYALVGQPRGLVNGVMTGYVLVYEFQEERWVQVATLTPGSLGTQNAQFGGAVAMDGPVALVGAEGENNQRGAAYIYERRDGAWTYIRRFNALVPDAQTSFGRAVALANGYALVGAPGAMVSHVQQGIVYVFWRSGNTWLSNAIQKLVASDARATYGFGARLAMLDSVSLVGSPEHDAAGTAQQNIGAAYVFELDRGLWRERARLRASDGRPGDVFGSALALSGQEAVVGAPGHAGQGAVYVFQRQTTGWSLTEVQKLLASDGEPAASLGAAVALTGGQLLSGAYGHAVQNQALAGAVYVYTRQGHLWSEVGQVAAPPPVLQAHFGYALALSEQHALVGAPGLLGSPPGRVYTYGVLPSNTLPVITSTPLTTALVGSTYVYDVEATDADGDTLTYGLDSAPTGMLLEPATGQITWTPTTPGDVTVQVEVQDEQGGQATQTYSIVVSLPNQPPQITSTPGTSAAINPVIPLLSVSDAHLARYTVTLNGQAYVPGTPITAAGDYVFTVAAMDVAGNTSVKTVHFTLRRPSVP